MKKNKARRLENSNFCIFCAAEIPEGRMLCPDCEAPKRTIIGRPRPLPHLERPETEKNRSEGTP